MSFAPASSSSSAHVAADGASVEYELDRAAVHRAWTTIDSKEFRTCNNAIDDSLVCTGTLVARRGTERLFYTPEFEAYVQRWFLPFALGLKDMVNALGVAAIHFVRLENGGFAPMVPARETYAITTYSPGHGQQAYRFYWRAIDAPAGVLGTRDDSVHIVSDFGYSPTLLGGLRSNAAAAAELVDFANELLASALVAERVLRLPPIYLEPNPGALNADTEVKKGEGYYGSDSPSDQARTADLMYRRTTPAQIALYEANMRAYRAINRISLKDVFGVDTAPETARGTAMRDAAAGAVDADARQQWANQFYVPTNRQLSSAVALPVRNDALNEHLERVQRDVCRLLGVPLEALTGSSMRATSSSGSSAATDASAELFGRTVRHWGAVCSRVITAVYDHLFAEIDFRHTLQALVAKRSSSARTARTPATAFVGTPAADMPRFIDEDDIFAADQATRVVFEFDVAPRATHEELDSLYTNSIIDWAPYARGRTQLAGLPASFARASDTWTPDERQALLLPPPPATASSSSSTAKRKPASSSSKSSSSSAKRKRSK